MFSTFINAFKVKDIRRKLLFTLGCLVVVRLGSLIPAPGINQALVANYMATLDLGFFTALTGGSLSQMSIFALNISPYITSSIIMQLLTIAIPALAELQKDGESGKKKIAEFSRYLTVALALIESTAMAIGFSNKGFTDDGVLTIILIVVSFTAGSAFLMWLGENITEHGVGNGISIILGINIIASLPSDFVNLYNTFVKGASKTIYGILAAVVIIAIVLVLLVLIILLQDAQRKIAVQYSKKMQGRKMVGGNSTYLPLKVNTAGVIPVIFAMSIFQFPVIISSFFGVHGSRTTFWRKVLYMCNTQNWFDLDNGAFKYTVGAILYVIMLIFFAYFYTSVTFNPIEVASNMKKNGGFIPGIRPGKPTTDYLTKVLNYIVLIGALFLAVVALIPIVFSGLFNAAVSFGGTSLIIVVGVVLETMKQIESQLLVRHYKGFLND